MPKISICKIHMIGSPALVLGLGRRFVEGDEHWDAYQMFTLEEYGEDHLTETQSQNPDSFFQPKLIQEIKKFWGKEVNFSSINKSFPIKQFIHDFNFKENQEISMEDLNLIREEMRKDGWVAFDDETWGK